MTQFVVQREAGRGWTPGKGAFEQPGASEHAAFMNKLAEEGFVLLAGPVAGSERDRIRALLVVEAAHESEIHARLAHDPWAAADLLRTVSVESWNVFVGAERLAAAGAQPLAYSSAAFDSNS
jgi:uncharacterized protein YciI